MNNTAFDGGAVAREVRPHEGLNQLYLMTSMMRAIDRIAEEKSAGELWIKDIINLARAQR